MAATKELKSSASHRISVQCPRSPGRLPMVHAAPLRAHRPHADPYMIHTPRLLSVKLDPGLSILEGDVAINKQYIQPTNTILIRHHLRYS
jgi:hypothetical protein